MYKSSSSPQGDRPLPAPREAGPWAPAFGGAGLGRLGEWRPPGPSRLRFRFCFFFYISLCSYAGLSNRVTERSSAVRGCRAALSHRVQTVCCLSSCCTLLFSFFLHIHLIADFRFFDALLLLSELSRRGFVSSSLLDLTHTCTPGFGHD